MPYLAAQLAVLEPLGCDVKSSLLHYKYLKDIWKYFRHFDGPSEAIIDGGDNPTLTAL